MTINWDLWIETGMVVNNLKKASTVKKSPAKFEEVQHPLWDECRTIQAAEKIFVTTLSVSEL
jgi:hypothetical protein